MTVQSGPHILAIGEALIDVVMTYEQPDFPVEIPGGSPANVALTLGRLGRPVALATWIGLDEYGRLIDFHMYDSGVHVTGASRGASHTSPTPSTWSGHRLHQSPFRLRLRSSRPARFRRSSSLAPPRSSTR